MGGVDLPLAAIREQIRRGIDLVVHQERGEDGRRRIVEIAELASGGGDGYELRSLAA
jgi:pilus assembly protein CpaF